MKTRQAKLCDINEMTSLLKLLFEIEADFEFDSKKHQQALSSIIKNKHCGAFVAVNNQQKVIGMCSVQWVISSATGKKSAWAEDMVVTPEYQGSGIGQALITAVEEWAVNQGCNRIQLVYDIHNQPAISFYKKQKFNSTQLSVFSKNL